MLNLLGNVTSSDIFPYRGGIESRPLVYKVATSNLGEVPEFLTEFIRDFLRVSEKKKHSNTRNNSG